MTLHVTMAPNAKSSSISAPVLAASFAYMLSAFALVLMIDQNVFQGGGLPVLTVIMPAITLCVLRLIHSTWLHLVSVFVALSSLFSFGQVWMELFGLPSVGFGGYADVGDMFPSAILDRALGLALTATCMVAIGSIAAAFLLPVQRAGPVGPSSFRSHPSRVPWLVAGLGLFGLVLAGDAARAANVAALGYGEGYKFESSILYTANYLFPLAVIAIMITWRNARGFVGLVLAAALVRNLYVILAVQNRGQAVAESVVFLLVWSTYFGFPKRWKLPSLILAVGALALLPYVSIMRSGMEDRNFIGFLLENDPVSVFLTEFGGTLASVAYAVQYVDAGGQTMGASYLVYLVGTAIPGLGSVLTAAAGQPLTAEALNSYFGRTGLGGSFVADLILNLGTGPLTLGVSMALGFVLTLLARAQSDLTDRGPYRLIWSWFVYLGAIVVVRGYLTDLATAVKVGGVAVLLVWVITQIGGAILSPAHAGKPRADEHRRTRRRMSSRADQIKDEG